LFARPPQPRLAPIDLVETLRALADELRPLAEAGSCKFTLQLPDTPLVAHADKTQVAVAIRALCTNAIEAQSGGGHVELRIDRVAANGDDAPSNPGETVQITVTDSGPGIPPEMRPHIFDPFFSGREAGRGLGFGLSKCWRIVSMHGGRIDVASRQGQGSVFTITLPRRPA
jgi:signal transduction histidine kinase